LHLTNERLELLCTVHRLGAVFWCEDLGTGARARNLPRLMGPRLTTD
jgi:hypothetical protein